MRNLLCIATCLCLITTASAQEPSGIEAAAAIEKSLVETIAACESSVVAIARVRKNEDQGFEDASFPGAPPNVTDPNFVPNEYGTGVVIDRGGLILTTYHILGNPDENDYYVWLHKAPFKVVKVESTKAGDPWMDLAVLKIEAENLTPIKFGDAAAVRKGQIVVALGNPLAIARDGEVSASWGIVSNLARKAPPLKNDSADGSAGRETLHHYGTLIQTDAKLNLGTSGGALINLKGEMVGLITSLTAGMTTENSAGFAIPVDEHFKRTVDVLKSGRRADYGFLGVLPWSLTREERQRGLRGARVREVVQGTPATNADLRSGDVILAINNRPIIDDSDLIRDVSARQADDQIELTIQRNSQLITQRVTLSKKQLQTTRPPYSQVRDPKWRGVQVEYATAVPAFFQFSRLLDTRGCVAVVDVERNSTAWNSGLRPGDFISQVDKRSVTSPREFFQAVDKRAEEVTVTVNRNGESANYRIAP